MKRRSLTSASAVVCAAAITLGLSLAGATAASATPPAPPTTMSANQSFVVPSGSLPGATSVFFLGQYYAAVPSDNIAAFGVYIKCDDGAYVPVAATSFSPGDVRTGRLDTAQFTGYIPIAEVGHTCVIHGVAPAGRSLVFDKPWNKPSDHDEPRLMFDSTTIVKSSNGGL